MDDQSTSQNQKVSQEEINKVLEGAPYPASKEDLIKYAQGKGASGEILNTLQSLPGVVYQTTNALTEALNKLLPLNLKDTVDKLL